MRKKYKFGDCIPASVKVYNSLINKWLHPKIVEGWVEVINGEELEPCEDFLELYYPDMLNDLNKNKYFNDYPRVLQHTWIICNGKIIDKTVSQFDIYGGASRYFEKGRYHFRGKQKANLSDIELGLGIDEVWQDNLQIHIAP